MIINPKSVDFVKNVAEEGQYQPNGVDLRVAKVSVVDRQAEFVVRDDFKMSGQLKDKVHPVDVYKDEAGEYVVLIPGHYYLFDTHETVELDANTSGLVKHRSSVNRATMRIESGWWDSGYCGGLGGSITVNSKVRLYLGSRIAQLVLWQSDTESTYQGQWNGKDSVGVTI